MRTSDGNEREWEISGPRITVFHLIPDFLDPDRTESQIALQFGIETEQVAKARSYFLNHFDEVIARHMDIESRNAAGNPPDVLAKFEVARTSPATKRFREWRDDRDGTVPVESTSAIPSFRQWVSNQSQSTVSAGS